MVKRPKRDKYEKSIDAEIDLHGYTREEARSAVSNFIREEQASGSRHVRIIVGKGTHSHDGESVLGPVVKGILVRGGYEYTYAKRAEGGEGALIVTL